MIAAMTFELLSLASLTVLAVVLTTGYTKVFDADPEFPVLRKPYQISTLGRVIHDALKPVVPSPSMLAS